MPRLKITLEDKKIEEICQEVYDDANKQMILINDKMNELLNSTNLKGEEVTIYDKVQITKGIADLIKLKGTTLNQKLEVAKLIREYNAKKGKKIEDEVNSSKFSFDDIKKMIETESADSPDKKEKKYKI